MSSTSARIDRSLELFHAGCACSQAVFAAYSDLFGIDEACAMRLSCGLGAGVGRLRNVCGAVSAMALLAGLKYGSETPGDAEAKRKTYEVVRQMASAFQARHGSIVCRELLGRYAPKPRQSLPNAPPPITPRAHAHVWWPMRRRSSRPHCLCRTLPKRKRSS